MEVLRGFLVQLFGVFFAMAVGILIMIKGWGLEPKSWWWIIVIGFFGHLIAQVIIHIGMHKG